MRALYGAHSTLALILFEDLLGGRARINEPGKVDATNWTYRAPKTIDELLADEETTHRLAEIVHRGRAIAAALTEIAGWH